MNFGEAPGSWAENTRAEATADLVPIAEAARRYMEVMSPAEAAVPSHEQVSAVERELAGRLPLFQLPGGTMATTRAALDSYIALKRAF